MLSKQSATNPVLNPRSHELWREWALERPERPWSDTGQSGDLRKKLAVVGSFRARLGAETVLAGGNGGPKATPDKLSLGMLLSRPFINGAQGQSAQSLRRTHWHWVGHSSRSLIFKAFQISESHLSHNQGLSVERCPLSRARRLCSRTCYPGPIAVCRPERARGSKPAFFGAVVGRRRFAITIRPHSSSCDDNRVGLVGHAASSGVSRV
ncbi:MAG: hypothetical protein QOJ15_5875 [Bradyrhizobium sp.]|jgi:hypothetical protein|nr:hypothetical protein [Bradyrhizobium sp.]